MKADAALGLCQLLGLEDLNIWRAGLPGLGQAWCGKVLDMSVNLRVSGLLASVCLFGVVSGGAVFAQDAVLDEVVVDQPAVDAPADAVDAAVEPAVVEDVAIVDDVAAAAPPERVALAVPAPGEQTGYEEYDDEELQGESAWLQRNLDEVNNYIENIAMECEGDCEGDIEDAIMYRDFVQNDLDNLNEEIRRRQPAVVVTPEVTPAVTPVRAIDRRDDAAPPREFCTALAASGSRADCGWSYRQSK